MEALKRENLEKAFLTEGIWDDIAAGLVYYMPKLRIYILFSIWVVIGVTWACLVIKWSVLESAMFVLTTLSTSGLKSIPDNASNLSYALVAVYMTIGIPLMAVVFGITATAAVARKVNDISNQEMLAPITEEELCMMRSFGMEDGDGSLDTKEFIILMLVRIGVLNPELVCIINQQFYDIDTNGTGTITYEDITKADIMEHIVMRVNKFKSNISDGQSTI
mmetsp:Transcript_520/g.922  ORF Transcript_520/g.922 Transcript_520/m.922 type:complete len:220 (+) Transcript_520:44-703(+)